MTTKATATTTTTATTATAAVVRVMTSSAWYCRKLSVYASGHGQFGALGQQNYDDIAAESPRVVHYDCGEGHRIEKVAAGWCVGQSGSCLLMLTDNSVKWLVG